MMITKKVSLAILCVFSVIFMNAQDKKPQFISSLIGFYNLENLYDTINNPLVDDDEFLPKSGKKYNTKIYEKKIENLATVISQIGADVNPDGVAILGVAEIENDTVLTDLVLHDKLIRRGYQYVHFNSPDFRGIDVALLYNPKYFTVTHKQTIHVELPDGYPTRDILYVKGLLNGEPIHLFVNHWPSRRGGGNRYDLNSKEFAYRNAQSMRGRSQITATNTDRGATSVTSNQRYITDAGSSGGSTINRDALFQDGEETTRKLRVIAASACKMIIDSINNVDEKAKIIIMGDLNDDPNNESVTKTIKAISDISKVQEKEIYNPYYDIHKKGFGTLAYNGKWNLFDQVMFSQPFLNQQQDGWFLFRTHIFFRDFLIEQKGSYKGYPKRTWSGDEFIDGYSDHLPVYTILLKQVND